MYTQEELATVKGQLRRRWLITAVPAAAVFAAAVALFVYGQLHRNDRLWVVTATMTIIAGCYFLFLYGVYVRPLRMYRIHIGYMLTGRKRETTGAVKAISDKTSEKNGVDCYTIMLNVGEKDDGEDDRLFYYDAHKQKPELPLGTRITVQSNDMMVADLKTV